MDLENAGAPAGRNKAKLAAVLGLTMVYLIAEVVGGLVTGSLALLADAGHMATDVAGLALALLAIWFGGRPATPERTYGYHRVEIMAALANAVVLLFISVFILYEAYRRFIDPPEVASGWMLVVAAVGLVVNLAGIAILRSDANASLNMKGAYFEVLSDLLASVGVIIAGLIMWFTGWYYADPLFSVVVGLFILPRTWKLLMDAAHVLLEGTPSDVDLAALRESISHADGVADVHDLHAWSLTSGMNALSAHIVLADGADHGAVLADVRRIVVEGFPIAHTTIQVEPRGWEDCQRLHD